MAMKKVATRCQTTLYFIFLLLFSVNIGIASTDTPPINYDKDIVFKAGIIKLIDAVAIHTSSFESGIELRSKAAKIIKETTNIKFKINTVFGVSIDNIKTETEVVFAWKYPTIHDKKGRNSISIYKSRKYKIRKKHHIYWLIDKSEKPGRYQLDIYLNGHLANTTIFKVRKQKKTKKKSVKD